MGIYSPETIALARSLGVSALVAHRLRHTMAAAVKEGTGFRYNGVIYQAFNPMMITQYEGETDHVKPIL